MSIGGLTIKNYSGGSNMYNYSLEEQMVGTWIDGKPLYKKTITQNDGTQVVIDGITRTNAISLDNNIRVINIEGGVSNSDNTIFRPFEQHGSNSAYIWISYTYGGGNTNVITWGQGNNASISSAILLATIYYIKTDD